MLWTPPLARTDDGSFLVQDFSAAFSKLLANGCGQKAAAGGGDSGAGLIGKLKAMVGL